MSDLGLPRSWLRVTVTGAGALATQQGVGANGFTQPSSGQCTQPANT
jgi:hypothetical protein